jgi:hypothetical protein
MVLWFPELGFNIDNRESGSQLVDSEGNRFQVSGVRFQCSGSDKQQFQTHQS